MIGVSSEENGRRCVLAFGILFIQNLFSSDGSMWTVREVPVSAHAARKGDDPTETGVAAFLLPSGVAMFLRHSGTVGVGWLAIAGLALAGGETYLSVMSEDGQFCEAVAEVLNHDAGRDGDLQYERAVFRCIAWTPVKLSGQAPRDGRVRRWRRRDSISTTTGARIS